MNDVRAALEVALSNGFTDETLAKARKQFKDMCAEDHERRMRTCICEYDGDARDDGTPYVYRIPKAGCAVHAEEDAE